MEFLWKAISAIINRRLSSSIQFHDILRRFHAGRVTGTSTLEAKMLRHIIVMRDRVLHGIFLNIIKAYGALNRERCLDILAGYGVGPRTIRIIWTYWSQLQIASKAGGYYGPAFQSHRRVTQGEPLSPTIFNVVVDSIIQKYVTVVGVIRRAPDRREWTHQSRTSWRSSMLMTYSSRCPIASAFSSYLTP